MIKLARPFQNHMILQRNKPVKVWGSSDCDDCVSVILNHSEIMQIEIRFAETNFCVVNLFNGAGLPARPFSVVL